MTFSLLARDAETGALGGVAATGNLCVGAWVLRGDARAGMTASQGKTPSTLWGEEALALLRGGASAADVVAEVTGRDAGRDTRQLAVLSRDGGTAGFDGADNHPVTGHVEGAGWIVAGNWLSSGAVIQSVASALSNSPGRFEERLLGALKAGVGAGSDARGTMSAALLVVAEDRPPLSLRVDWDTAPVERLVALYEKTCTPHYATWLKTLPTLTRPEAT